MAQIKDEKQYNAIMARIDQLFFETDENTPADDFRLQELDMLSALAEEYEKEHHPINARLMENNWTQKQLADILGITAPRLCAIINGKTYPTFEQARLISSRLNIDPAIVLSL